MAKQKRRYDILDRKEYVAFKPRPSSRAKLFWGYFWLIFALVIITPLIPSADVVHQALLDGRRTVQEAMGAIGSGYIHLPCVYVYSFLVVNFGSLLPYVVLGGLSTLFCLFVILDSLLCLKSYRPSVVIFSLILFGIALLALIYSGFRTALYVVEVI